MKLKESKEKVPATFVTSYISDAWEKVGIIKADIDAIKANYSNTKLVEECLQDILDAYLIAAGRLQAFLDNKNYVELPEESVKAPIKESLDKDTTVGDVEVNIDTVNITPPMVEDDLDTEMPIVRQKLQPMARPVPQRAPQPAPQFSDDFEFTCDFDEPELTQEDMDNANKILNVAR